MFTRSIFLALAGSAAAAPLIATPAPDTEAERIFRRAKQAWLLRNQTPFVTFGLRESYVWRDRPHENWWRASFRSADEELVLQRVIVQSEEEQRLKGISIGLHIHYHLHGAHVENLDTNPDADAFPILDPLVTPTAAFGMIRQGGERLVGAATASPGESETAVPGPTAAPTASPNITPEPGQTPLRELTRVEVFGRDYNIVLVGTEHLVAGDAYHLSLTPLRDPKTYRLRDLWVATDSYATLQLAVDGLFEGKPYDEARWVVNYVQLGGLYYVQQIHTDDVLRFGLDRKISGFTFDFVDYAFPATMPDYVFQKLL